MDALQTCTNTLMIRHMMRPFRPGDTLEDHAVPMIDLIKQLQAQLAEFRALKDQVSTLDTGSSSPLPSVAAVPIQRAVFLGNNDRSSNTPTVVDLGSDSG